VISYASLDSGDAGFGLTIEELGNLGELIAAIATVVTLAYLALQIRQSNRSNQLTSVARIGASTERWLAQLIHDTELLDVYLRGMTAPDTFSREERARFNLLIIQLLRSGETLWLEVNLGVVDLDHWAGFQESLRTIVGCEAGRQAWDQNRRVFSKKFADYVDEVLAQDA
jgi:hypothetical protein